MKNSQIALVATFLSAVLASSLVMAEGPAVSDINGKVSIQGGDMNGRGASSIDAALSVPLAPSLGLQLDASSGRLLNSNYSGYGGHLFWRDPTQGLVGLVGAHQKLGDRAANRHGIEGEAYLNKFSLGLRGGRQTGDVEHGGYAGLGARWYMNDNLVFNLGYDHSPGSIKTTGLGLEWQPTNWGPQGMTLFARGNTSTGSNHAATLGVRFYFGGNKSLMQRHRTDDPESLVMPVGDVIPTPNIRAPAVIPVGCPAGYYLEAGACTNL